MIYLQCQDRSLHLHHYRARSKSFHFDTSHQNLPRLLILTLNLQSMIVQRLRLIRPIRHQFDCLSNRQRNQSRLRHLTRHFQKGRRYKDHRHLLEMK
jgi:hypothetical protein